jgi:hypothetical protein
MMRRIVSIKGRRFKQDGQDKQDGKAGIRAEE